MARKIGKLTPLEVRAKTKPGVYGDGAGLYLNIGPTGSKSWVLRYMIDGKAREMGLGALHTVGLADARERARAAREKRLDGVDPLDFRREEKARKATEAAATAAALVTFRRAATSYIEANKPAWRNSKHAAQWTATLEKYAFPTVADMAVSKIETGHVTSILTPIWTTKAETASRVRGRIETVLDFAKVQGWRTGENPARWKGHLDHALPARGKVAVVKHHAALAWEQVAAFMAEVKKQEGVAALALQFVILTAARTEEVIGATWGEFDPAGGLWIVPADRMKGNREHRVPLTAAALAVLEKVAELRQDKDDPAAIVFPGGRNGTGAGPLSNMAMLALLRRMQRGDLTTHGFRSSFRDWAAERTAFENFVVEKALAHVVADKVEAAYRRGDLLEKRRNLMEAWAAFCMGTVAPSQDNVVQLRATQ